MYCGNCGTQNDDRAMFCQNCGAKLEGRAGGNQNQQWQQKIDYSYQNEIRKIENSDTGYSSSSCCVDFGI